MIYFLGDVHVSLADVYRHVLSARPVMVMFNGHQSAVTFSEGVTIMSYDNADQRRRDEDCAYQQRLEDERRAAEQRRLDDEQAYRQRAEDDRRADEQRRDMDRHYDDKKYWDDRKHEEKQYWTERGNREADESRRHDEKIRNEEEIEKKDRLERYEVEDDERAEAQRLEGTEAQRRKDWATSVMKSRTGNGMLDLMLIGPKLALLIFVSLPIAAQSLLLKIGGVVALVAIVLSIFK